jgi:hypothetical protein
MRWNLVVGGAILAGFLFPLAFYLYTIPELQVIDGINYHYEKNYLEIILYIVGGVFGIILIIAGIIIRDVNRIRYVDAASQNYQSYDDATDSGQGVALNYMPAAQSSSAPMICRFCGAPREAKGAFCGRCGAKLG